MQEMRIISVFENLTIWVTLWKGHCTEINGFAQRCHTVPNCAQLCPTVPNCAQNVPKCTKMYKNFHNSTSNNSSIRQSCGDFWLNLSY